MLTFTPVASGSGDYDIPQDSILCNGLNIFNPRIYGVSTLALLVASLNTNLSAMGTWAVASATTITLTGAVCTSVNIPWTVD